MEHVKELGIKFLAIAVSIYAIFGIFSNANWVNLLWISLLVTGISYLVGDMVVLPRFGNITATIADFGLAFLSLLILGGLFLGAEVPIITTSLLTAFFITCCEPFIHGYIANHFSPDSYERKDLRTQNQLQTEFAEETNEHTITKNKHHSDM
ncbi:YndM family protein [Virgibacillus dakarensis]|nr:YndM family protein [Virgibacillus dakarensis]